MSLAHDLHDMAHAIDEHDLADRRTQARDLEQELAAEPDPCTCSHDPEDHWPHEGCVRRDCLCWWWAT